MTKKIYILLLSLFIYSCNSNFQDENKTEIVINYETVNDIHVEDLFEELTFKSIDNCGWFVPGIAKIVYYKSNIAFFDSQNIYLFSDNFKPITKISKKGRAKGEYISISDFDLYEDLIAVLDRTSRKVILYNLSGSFISEIKLNIYASSIMIKDGATLLLHNDYSEFGDTQKGKIASVDIKTGDISFLGGKMDSNRCNYMKPT